MALNDPSSILADILVQARHETVDALSDATAQTLKLFPNAYAANVFKNASKCKRLVDAISDSSASNSGGRLPLLSNL